MPTADRWDIIVSRVLGEFAQDPAQRGSLCRRLLRQAEFNAAHAAFQACKNSAEVGDLIRQCARRCPWRW